MYVVEIANSFHQFDNKREAIMWAKTKQAEGWGEFHLYRKEPDIQEDTTEYCSITGADMTPKGPDMNGCPCCGWHMVNGECNACGQKVTQPFPGMCEQCGENVAEKGDFICMECISSNCLKDQE